MTKINIYRKTEDTAFRSSLYRARDGSESNCMRQS